MPYIAYMTDHKREKPLFWIGSSRNDLKDCQDEVQDFIAASGMLFMPDISMLMSGNDKTVARPTLLMPSGAKIDWLAKLLNRDRSALMLEHANQIIQITSRLGRHCSQRYARDSGNQG